MTVFAYTLHKRFGGGRWTPGIVELLANGAQQAAGGIVRHIVGGLNHVIEIRSHLLQYLPLLL